MLNGCAKIEFSTRWGRGAVGSAPRWHRGGRGFESHRLHQNKSSGKPLTVARHIHVVLSACFAELAVLDARLYIRVRRIDELAYRCGACGRSRSQLHMAHELACALQQAGRIRQRCAVKEPDVDVRGEYIYVAEGRISQTCHRIAVMQKLPDFRPRTFASPQTSDARWLPIHLHAVSSTH
jgi:hypothetical protein